MYEIKKTIKMPKIFLSGNANRSYTVSVSTAVTCYSCQFLELISLQSFDLITVVYEHFITQLMFYFLVVKLL